MSHQYNFNQLQAIARVSGAYLPESGEIENAFANDLATFNDERLGGKFGTEGYRLVRDRIDTEIRLAKEEEEENADRQLENIGLMEDIRKDLQNEQSINLAGMTTEQLEALNESFKNPENRAESIGYIQNKYGFSEERAEEIQDKAEERVDIELAERKGEATEEQLQRKQELDEDPDANITDDVIQTAAERANIRSNNFGVSAKANITSTFAEEVLPQNISPESLKENFSFASAGGNVSEPLSTINSPDTVRTNESMLGLG